MSSYAFVYAPLVLSAAVGVGSMAASARVNANQGEDTVTFTKNARALLQQIRTGFKSATEMKQKQSELGVVKNLSNYVPASQKHNAESLLQQIEEEFQKQTELQSEQATLKGLREVQTALRRGGTMAAGEVTKVSDKLREASKDIAAAPQRRRQHLTEAVADLDKQIKEISDLIKKREEMDNASSRLELPLPLSETENIVTELHRVNTFLQRSNLASDKDRRTVVDLLDKAETKRDESAAHGDYTSSSAPKTDADSLEKMIESEVLTEAEFKQANDVFSRIKPSDSRYALLRDRMGVHHTRIKALSPVPSNVDTALTHAKSYLKMKLDEKGAKALRWHVNRIDAKNLGAKQKSDIDEISQKLKEKGAVPTNRASVQEDLKKFTTFSSMLGAYSQYVSAYKMIEPVRQRLDVLSEDDLRSEATDDARKQTNIDDLNRIKDDIVRNAGLVPQRVTNMKQVLKSPPLKPFVKSDIVTDLEDMLQKDDGSSRTQIEAMKKLLGSAANAKPNMAKNKPGAIKNWLIS